MNLKVTGAILPLGCAILSTRAKTVRGVGTTPLGELGLINPRLTKLFFVTRLTKGGCRNPSLDVPNRTPYEIDFGINR